MSNAKIMVVEDEYLIADDIRITLENLGYEVPAIALSAEAAIEKVEEVKPDLVLIDIVLKGEMDGIEAAEQIRSRFGIPVVYLTAYSDKKAGTGQADRTFWIFNKTIQRRRNKIRYRNSSLQS